MNKKITSLLLAIAMAGGLAGCATMPPGQAGTSKPDSGYFLSLRQKGQLIWTGRIEDAQGVWYDVWIVPGYAPPARRTGTYLQRTVSDFAEYFQARKYHDLADDSGDVLEWAYDDCLTDFTVKGVPRAWKRYWSTANQRTRQRVFGWWLAYPWALLESTADTVVRIPAGLAGTAIGTICGITVVPGYHAVNSAAAGTWHFAVDAVLVPTVACTWNTLVSPPLALVGQKPAPSRADGFWLKQLGENELHASSAALTPITSKDVEALAAWGRLLVTVSQPFEDRRRVLREQAQAEHEAIYRRLQQAEADIRKEEQGAISAIVTDPTQQETIEYLTSRGFDSRRTSQAMGNLRRYLLEHEKLPPAGIGRTLDLLITYPPSTATNAPPLREKTDPVRRSVEVMKDVD
ncbi:MAG: hypothetical protein WCL44_02255 [bacterium]